jgi:hypothetical protein
MSVRGVLTNTMASCGQDFIQPTPWFPSCGKPIGFRDICNCACNNEQRGRLCKPALGPPFLGLTGIGTNATGKKCGGVNLVGNVQEEGIALTFNNEAEAAEALEHDIVVIDRSHCGRLRVSGDDRLSFLHGQSTNSFTSLTPGQGCDTVR